MDTVAPVGGRCPVAQTQGQPEASRRGARDSDPQLPGEIDPAFQRRIRFTVDFPQPSTAERRRLWELMLSRDADVAPAIDLERLAGAFEFTGASIKDAVLRAAFRAAEAGTAIDGAMLEQAGIAVAREQGTLVRVVDGRVALRVEPEVSAH